MDKEIEGGRRPGHDRSIQGGHIENDATVYVPAGQPDVIYVRIDGAWCPYTKSAPCPEVGAGTTVALAGAQADGPPDSSFEPRNLHWAGHGDGESLELARTRRVRVYYDPQSRPDLFIANDGGPPAAPLPDLELDNPPGDPAPWVDPEGGARFTSEQARTVSTVLRYAPRENHPGRNGMGYLHEAELKLDDSFVEFSAKTRSASHAFKQTA